MQIRPANADEAETIAECQSAMAMETEGLALDPETVRAGVGAVFDDPAKGQWLVAEEGGQVAACMLTIPEWSDWRNGWTIWIHSVYVRPEFRRRGIFRTMYAHLKERVESDDTLVGLRLFTHRDNAGAQRTYESLGMDGDHNRLYEWME